ncbi:MAG TPA: sulfatase [Sphingobacteriaceae bacterium]|nr:sulfatase [Sphingobacteriaceae bacterium]
MKNFRIILFFQLLILPAAFVSAQNAAKPNVVIIMADDLDSRELSCYGGQNIKTPNIDRLAREGMKFNNIYASEAMCVPTRASLFTGLYPARHGSYQNHKTVYKNTKSIGHYLGDLGYRVGLTGKNHSIKPASVFPFEIIKGFEPNCVAETDDYTLDGVRDFISKKDKPYCLFVMSVNPHAPWTVGDPSEFNPDKLILPPHWVDTRESRLEYCKYLAEVRRLDNQVGDILKTLKETGQDKNTLVVFLGEQGPQFPGGKWTLYNYGAKTSMLARLPGKIKPGTQANAIVQYEDITPTLVDLAGGKSISNLDGKSFLPVLTGRTELHRDYAYGIHNNIPEGPAYPIRSIRDKKFKLINNLLPDKKYYIKHSMNTNNKKVIWTSWMKKAETDSNARMLTDRVVNHPAIEFYNTQKDPWELNNLAGDPAYKKMIEKYKSKLAAWMKQQGDTGAEMDKEITDENKSNNAKD